MKRRTLLAALCAASLPVPAWALRVQAGLSVHPQPRPMPELDIRDGESRPAGVDSFRGRPLLMNLWASWCTPCVAELPALDRLKPKAEAEGIAVMALCLDRSGNVGAVNTFARLGVKSLAVHVDYRRKATEMLDVPVLPTTLLITADGREAARFIGPAQWDGQQALALLRALKEGRPLNPAMAPPMGTP